MVREFGSRVTSTVEHNCQACGLWITVGDRIVIGRQAGFRWWVHEKCPSVYDNVDWLTEREYDFVTYRNLAEHTQRCARRGCGSGIEPGDEIVAVRRRGPLIAFDVRGHSDYVHARCANI